MYKIVCSAGHLVSSKHKSLQPGTINVRTNMRPAVRHILITVIRSAWLSAYLPCKWWHGCHITLFEVQSLLSLAVVYNTYDSTLTLVFNFTYTPSMNMYLWFIEKPIVTDVWGILNLVFNYMWCWMRWKSWKLKKWYLTGISTMSARCVFCFSVIYEWEL